MRAIAAASITMIVLCCSCASARTGSKETAMGNKGRLFELVDRLAATSDLRPEAVNKALGASLGFERKASNDAFETLTAPGASGQPFESVELRVSRDGGSNGFLLLSIPASATVTVPQVLAKYGAKPEVTMPSAHQPKGSPTYYTYRRKGVRLSFGFRPGKTPTLSSVVVDRTEP